MELNPGAIARKYSINQCKTLCIALVGHANAQCISSLGFSRNLTPLPLANTGLYTLPSLSYVTLEWPLTLIVSLFLVGFISSLNNFVPFSIGWGFWDWGAFAHTSSAT